MSLQKLAQTMRQIERFENRNECQRCYEYALIRYHVYSEIVDLMVCWGCAEEARKLGRRGLGGLSVESVH